MMLEDLVAYVPCHRRPERCLHFRGRPMPICARCFSMLLGYLFIPAAFFLHAPFWIGLLMQLPMLADGLTQKSNWRQSNNFLRVVTGLASGIGLSVMVAATVSYALDMLT